MSEGQRKKHKFCNLLRFGFKNGWVVPQQDGSVIIAQCAPDYFHKKLRKFEGLFQNQEALT